jgi:ribosomal protein L16 Arg81 hydroxylase
MTADIAAFADLIAPISPQAFLAANWEREPLHVHRADRAYYQSLLTARDVEEAVSSGGLRFPAIQLARNGMFFPAELFTRTVRSGDDVFSGIPDIDRIASEYRAGATISLPGFQRAWKPLAKLVTAIEQELDHPVHANVYMTPGNATGFAPHYDTHEVFVLQIAGAKRWRVYAPPFSHPHRSQPYRPQTQTSAAAVLDADLTQGDLLYLPRGFVHTTSTADSHSIHVTIGITVYTWVEPLAEWSRTSAERPAFRRALPPGFARRGELRPVLKTEFIQMLASLEKDANIDAFLDRFSKRVQAGQRGITEFNSDIIAEDTNRHADIPLDRAP